MARAVAPRVTKVPEIRTGDTVLLMAGKDAGKRGEVKSVERPALVGQPFRVVVDGLVREPLRLRPDDLRAMDSAEVTADFRCQEGWCVPGLHWEGVWLDAVLEAAGWSSRGESVFLARERHLRALPLLPGETEAR